MNNIILHQHPAWSLQAAARARLDGWDLYHEPVEPLPDEAEPVPGGTNLPPPARALAVALPAVNLPREY